MNCSDASTSIEKKTDCFEKKTAYFERKINDFERRSKSLKNVLTSTPKIAPSPQVQIRRKIRKHPKVAGESATKDIFAVFFQKIEYLRRFSLI